MWERCTIHTSFSHAFDPPLWPTKKRPSQGWRLGRFGGSAGRTARRICVLSGATLPPIARLTSSHRYSPNPCVSCIPKNAWSAPRPPLLAEAALRKRNFSETQSHWGSAQEPIPARSRCRCVKDRRRAPCRALSMPGRCHRTRARRARRTRGSHL
jgi:hypothetical protein